MGAAVYIVASRRNGTLYIGVTNDLARRIYEHREGLFEGFTKTYGCKKLVWYEPFENIGLAIRREKRLKKYPRQWKINLIEAQNPHWIDLYNLLNRQHPSSSSPGLSGRPSPARFGCRAWRTLDQAWGTVGSHH